MKIWTFIIIKKIFLLVPLVILLNSCFGGVASSLKSLKIFYLLFGGWGSRAASFRLFAQEDPIIFYSIIIIIILIIAYVIYLEINSQKDYLIRPYQVLLGISLIAIVIYIIASAPDPKWSKLEMIDYDEDLGEKQTSGICLNDDTNLESFELEFECFVSFLIDKITNENEVFSGGLLNKPQDIAGDALRVKVTSLLQFDTEIRNNDYKKIWSTAEEELISIINETIKQFYGIDDVLTNGFGENKIPLYTRNFVQQFKNVQIAFNKN